MKINIIIVILFLSIGMTSCKSTKTTKTTTIAHRIDSLSTIEIVTQVQVPVKNITVLERPCKDSILQPINQVLEIGKTKVIVKNLDGNLLIEIEKLKDSITSIKEVSILSDVKDTSTTEIKIITRYRIPKWIWFVLLASIGLNIWNYRKVIRKLIVGI